LASLFSTHTLPSVRVAGNCDAMAHGDAVELRASALLPNAWPVVDFYQQFIKAMP
jgi:hypothetical protein